MFIKNDYKYQIYAKFIHKLKKKKIIAIKYLILTLEYIYFNLTLLIKHMNN